MKKQRRKYKLTDFLPQQAIDNFIQKQDEIKLQGKIEIIEDNLGDLAEYLGRDMIEAEELAILDIVDKYTPKDGDGNYAFDLLPFEYAWKIYETELEKKRELLVKFLREL